MKYGLIILILFISISVLVEADDQTASKTDTSHLTTKNLDESMMLNTDDSLEFVKSMLYKARDFSTEGNYAKAFDAYWDGLIMAHKLDSCMYIPYINNGLGVLYSVFEMDNEAEDYFNKSLVFLKNIKNKSRTELSKLGNTYYILASHHRENGNNGIAQEYLDSCSSIQKLSKSTTSSLLIQSEQAYVYLNQRKYLKSIGILRSVEKEINDVLPSYQVVLFSMMGEVYYHLGDFANSEKYLLNSLTIWEKYKSHQNYIPDVYQKLSNLYVKTGNYKSAHRYLLKSKYKTEELFGVRSKKNRDLLEVKDAFRLEIQQQARILEEAHLHELEQAKKILFLRNLVLTILVVSLIIISLIVYIYLQKQRKQEQYNYEQKQKLSSEKNAEILDFKNKELTSSALQVIHKDELILEIKEQLGSLKGMDKRSLNKILTKIKVNKNQDWSEFEARFASVNQDFYDKLHTKFPSLTRKDQKLCALLKLNFSSKEIAQLLGISAESVITARYRLRKKMQLKKEEDLVEVIIAL